MVVGMFKYKYLEGWWLNFCIYLVIFLLFLVFVISWGEMGVIGKRSSKIRLFFINVKIDGYGRLFLR